MSQNLQNPAKTAKRYFWLKLHQDFFNRDEIRIIESQPNGKDYIIFYLKLMLKSINDNGRLLFRDTIPYTPEMLASITQTSVDTVRVAIDAFTKLGLITLLDDGALFMQEVQKLVGSETPDAERMRLKRAEEKAQPKLPIENKARTNSEHCSKNVTLENKSLELEKRNNSPYNPPSRGTLETRDGFGVGSICKKNNYQFSKSELDAINQWFKYKSSKFGKPLIDIEIERILSQLSEHKTKGFDIAGMINRSIANGYTGVMSPTKEFLKNSRYTTPAKPNTKYSAPEYIIPETSIQKKQLQSYISSCYLNKINPKTGVPMSADELKIIKAHYNASQHSSPYMGWDEYIYQKEVLAGICLLDQPLAIG